MELFFYVDTRSLDQPTTPQDGFEVNIHMKQRAQNQKSIQDLKKKKKKIRLKVFKNTTKIRLTAQFSKNFKEEAISLRKWALTFHPFYADVKRYF